MSYILKNGKGLYLVQDKEGKRYWGSDILDAIRFKSSMLADREADYFDLSDKIMVEEYHDFRKLPEFPDMNFDFYYSQASKHLRQADMKGPPGSAITENGLNSAIMHAEFALAFLKMAKSNLQGELF